MEHHFSWLLFLEKIGVNHDNLGVATSILVGILLIILGLFARFSLNAQKGSFEPASHFSVRGIFEVFTEFIANQTDMIIGDGGRKYVPLFATVFIYIFVNNIFGLIPGMTSATADINKTLAVGLFVFFVYNWEGIREHGVGYLKHFLGPLMLLAPIMLPIELISHIVRPMSLGLRLAGNMSGDHTVLGIFLDLVPVGVPVIFYGLGLFVCLVQAFVFTLLSMVYVAMATSHDH